MDMFLESQGDNAKIRTGRENESFRFGPSKVYKSDTYYEIEVQIHNLKKKI